MRFLVRLNAPGASRESLTESVRTIAKTLGVDPRSPKWTSYGALEIDVFSPSRNDFDLFVSAVGPLASVEFTRDLNVAPPHMEEVDLLAEAKELFNAERYWETHEVLEGLWRTKQGDEKRLLQGVILLCAAFVHHQKGEDQIGLGIMERAVSQLEYPSTEYGGLNVVRLREESVRILRSGRFSSFRV